MELDSHTVHTNRDDSFTASRLGEQSPQQSSYVTWTDADDVDADREELFSRASANIPMGDSPKSPAVPAALRSVDALREDGETTEIVGTKVANERAYLEVDDEGAMNYDGVYAEDVFLARATRVSLEGTAPFSMPSFHPRFV